MDRRADADRRDRDRHSRQFDSNFNFDSRPNIFICAARDRDLCRFSDYVPVDLARFADLYRFAVQRFFAVLEVK